jgi:penicillin-binding protein 2
LGKGRIKDQWGEQRLFEQRVLIAGVVAMILSSALVSRLVWLQIFKHDYFTELSQGNRVRNEPIPASRGIIYDRNGLILAENRPAYQLELVREQVPDLEATLKHLVELNLLAKEDLDTTRRVIRSRRGFDSVPIRLRMSEEEIARFAVHRYEFQGVDIRTRLSRYYPQGALAVHALGYVAAIGEQDLPRIDRSAYAGTTLIGKLGVESAREHELHGTNGFREVLVNAQGRSVQKQGGLVPELRSRGAKAGTDIILSIDLAAQQAAEEGLKGRRGAVVALDPNNGDVLVLASQPGFDPGLFGRGLTSAEYRGLESDIDRPLFNRALRGAYPPGSTVKPVIALAGLRYNAVDPEEHRFCAGIYRLPGSTRQFREGKSGKHGSVNLEDAIAKSCDVYFYALANVLGVDHIAEFLGPFGYGKPTGIDISGELTGILPSRAWKQHTFKNPAEQVWFPGETVNFGIGQGYMTVTPLQQAHMVATIASRGRSFRPRLVTGLKDAETGKATAIAPQRMADVEGIPEKDWQIVFNGMVGTIQRGTGRAIGIGAPYTIAGKTGTAQVFSVAQNAKYVEKDVAERLRDHSWFVAFAPVEAPQIALVVLVENGGFGAAAAAPIARKVMDAYLLHKTPATEAEVVQRAAAANAAAAASVAAAADAVSQEAVD